MTWFTEVCWHCCAKKTKKKKRKISAQQNISATWCPFKVLNIAQKIVFTKRPYFTQLLFHFTSFSVLEIFIVIQRYFSEISKRHRFTHLHNYWQKIGHRSCTQEHFWYGKTVLCPPTWRKTHMTSWQQACVGGRIKQEPTILRFSVYMRHYNAHFVPMWNQENALTGFTQNTLDTILIVLTGCPAATVF